MAIVSGFLLTLITVGGSLTMITALGLPWARLLNPTKPGCHVIRHALWWGLLVLSITVLALNQLMPLSHPTVIVILLALSLVSALIGVTVQKVPLTCGKRRTNSRLLLNSAVVLIAGTFALQVLGPVTNYDSGLYHLGAIKYASEFATIPGLANVFFPFGYATTEFPLAAVLSWSPLGSNGYRALNVIVIVLALIDLVLRRRAREKDAGFWVLLTGLGVVVVTMLPLADYWVVSPTQDSSVFVLVVIAGAYFSEALTRRQWLPPAATSCAIAVTAVLLRPTMVVFAAAMVLGVVVYAVHRRHSFSRRDVLAPALLVAFGGAGGILVSAWRDFTLSGWWQYPLSVLPFDVEWLAPDPTSPRLATLGAARNPDDLWNAAESWNWISPWAQRAVTAWEFYAMAVLSILAIIAAWRVRLPRRVLLAMFPSAAAILFWFLFTPPSFRFAWGPLFTVATIPLGWALWSLARNHHGRERRVLQLATAGTVLVTLFTLVFRIDIPSMTSEQQSPWLPISYAYTPVTQVEIAKVELPTGLPALVPVKGDQCWDAYPLCSPQLPSSLRLRGTSIQDGFLP